MAASLYDGIDTESRAKALMDDLRSIRTSRTTARRTAPVDRRST